MVRNNATHLTAPQNNMTTLLTKNNEAEAFEGANHSAPETCGNLDMCRYVEGSNQRLAGRRDWKFLKVKLRRFAQIRQRFLNGFALRGCSCLGIQRGKSAFRCRNKNYRENHRGTPR